MKLRAWGVGRGAWVAAWGRFAVGVASLSLASPLAAQNPVRVTASVEPGRIAVGEDARLVVTIRTPGGQPESVRLPQLAGGLAVVGSQQSDRLQMSLPGGRTREITREIYLRGRTEGHYAIPPVVVYYDGRRYASRPLSVEVVRTPSVPTLSDAAIGPNGEVVLRSGVRPDTVWVGEQATLESDALFSDEVRDRLRRTPEYLAPSPAGLWTYDLPDIQSGRVEWIGGRRYEVHAFRRAYFPIEPGELEIPSSQLVYEVRRGFLYTPEQEELKSPPTTLVAMPLPDSGVPAAFNGAVGRFAVEAALSPDSVAVGEAAVLTLTVQGDGNIKALPAPRLDVDGARFESPGESAEFSGDDGVISGTKTFTWVVVPERPGPLELGPIEYAYFDPQAERYDVARSDSVTLAVTPGAAVAPGQAAGPEELELAPLTPRPAATLTAPSGWRFAALGAAPFALVLALAGLGVLVGRRRRRPAAPRRLRRRLRRDLGAIRDGDADGRAFHEAVERVARAWLVARTGREDARRATGAALIAALTDAGATPPAAGRVADLLDRVRRAPYRPEPPDAEEQRGLVDRLEEALLQLEKTLPKRGRSTRGAAVVLALLLAAPVGARGGDRADVGAASSPAAAEAPDAAADFAAGVRFFRLGMLDRSAERFRAYVESRPLDPEGWYDYGTVQAARGAEGPAVHALMRSLRLQPRHADARHNLEVLGVEDEWIAAARLWPPLTAAEGRWALLIALWATALALGWTLWARRRAPGSRGAAAALWTTVALVAVTGLSAAVWGAQARRVPVVAITATRIRAAPTLRSPDLGALTEARVGWLRSRRGEWVRLVVPGGLEGWVEARDVGVVAR